VNTSYEPNNIFIVILPIQGNHVFEVPDGYKLKIMPGSPGLLTKFLS